MLCLVLLVICMPAFANKKKTNWEKSLKAAEKSPYGMYVHRQLLQQLFPAATIKNDKKIFKFKNTYQDEPVLEGGNLKIFVAKKLQFTWAEKEKLMTSLELGNHIVMLAEEIDAEFLKKFELFATNNSDTSFYNKILTAKDDETEFIMQQNYYSYLNDKIVDTFSYKKCLPLSNFFVNTYLLNANNDEEAAVAAPAATTQHGEKETYTTEVDNNYGMLPKITYSKRMIVANENKEDIGYCIRYGKGKLILLCEPTLFTNYNLLQSNNQKLLEHIYSFFPNTIKNIQLHEFGNRVVEENNNNNSKNPLSGLMKYPMWRAAILLSVLGVLLYIIFNSKRRQREVPIIPPVTNTSLEFAETIGQLYYNKLDHKNIAEKMIAHFLEKVRTTFNIVTNKLDDDFANRLSKKSGAPIANVQQIIQQIDIVKQSPNIAEVTLVDLYKYIQQFNQYIP